MMRTTAWAGVILGLGLLCAAQAQAAASFSVNLDPAGGLQVSVGQANRPEDLAGVLKIFVLFSLLAVAPALILMCTSFTRIVIVLSFLRQALGVAHIPPNQVLIAIALFLTAFNMMPVWQQIDEQALRPYQAGKISWETFAQRGVEPVKYFLMRHTRPKDLALFAKLSHSPQPKSPADVSMMVLIPAFIISELKVAFQIGFLLYLPFLVVDMVVASILLSMGMMMLPPIMVSLPFKILLFVMVDGWNLLIYSLMKSFY